MWQRTSGGRAAPTGRDRVRDVDHTVPSPPAAVRLRPALSPNPYGITGMPVSSVRVAVEMSKSRGETAESEQRLPSPDGSAAEEKKQGPGSLLDRKSSMVLDLEEKVQRSKRDRRNSLHRTMLLESQMKTVRGELVDTLDQLQELRNVLRRSQQNAEERKAAMEKLAAGLR
ncbi:hypothetical protein JZ751_019021 [Albula glossodonta]|uniref:Uncharacterized protein n=1 Tax=Albula glossodonta TaxID=121402 RepID=A0A8T2NPG3_9TELE|nr:hypothetical protein JZ751_019021 [Albula glossodonta]